MVVIEAFKGAGLFAKVALLIMTVASMFAWIAFTCTGWGKSDAGKHLGLWRICSDDKYRPDCESVDGWALEWWAATQALVILGFLGTNVSYFLIILYIFVGTCSKNTEVATAAAIISFASAVLYLLGVIVFAAKFKEDYIDPRDSNPYWPTYELGYCFGLSVVAVVLEIVVGLLMVLDSKKQTAPTPFA